MPDDKQIKDAIEQTVQVIPTKEDGRAGGLASGYYGLIQRDQFSPIWGTRFRERWLRNTDRYDLNTLWQGAEAGIIAKIQSSPWEIKGPKSGVQYFQDMLRDSEFGMGWDNFIAMTIRDYMRQDIGAFWEIIGPGDPNEPITGRATGIAQLDALRCFPTGVPEFPVIYWPIGGERHWLHASRVQRFVSMPDNDETRTGTIGFCPLSRAIAVVQREFEMNKYVAERLDDKPKAGILLISNATKETLDPALSQFRENKQTDEQQIWGNTVIIKSLQQENPIQFESISFSEPPEKFDFRQYKVDIDVNELALAIGVDVQELWQLSGSAMGTGTQSAILHSKARGKTFGTCLKMIERAINNVLPPRYEFEFKFEDSQADLERVQVAQGWVGVVNQAGANLSQEEARRLLANTIPAVMDVITDEDGQIVRLDDADPVEEAIAPDIGDTPDAETAIDEDAAADDTKALKEFDDTRSEFVAAVMDTIEAAQAGDMPRRRFGIVMRANLRRLGTQSFQDGLEDGGVDAADMDDRDRAAVQEWLRIQSPFVTNFAERVFSNELSDAQIEAHANMWGNKSLRDAFQLGQASSQWNKSVMWVVGPTEESCVDCQRLNGQIHRFRDFKKKGWLPGARKLDCNGFGCLCKFKAAPGERAFGRF